MYEVLVFTFALKSFHFKHAIDGRKQTIVDQHVYDC